MLILLSYSSVYSQLDTNAIVTLYSSIPNENTIDVEIKVKRLDNDWFYFANATFQLAFNSNDIDYSQLNVEVVDTDPRIPYMNEGPSFNQYKTMVQVLDDRISLAVLGPEEIENCFIMPMGIDSVTAIRAIITTKNGYQLPGLLENDGLRIKWYEKESKPFYYYQAFAYKTDFNLDSLTYSDWYLRNDNIEVAAPSSFGYLSYEEDDTPYPQMILEYFDARYVGGHDVELFWKTKEEAFNKGFSIERFSKSIFVKSTNIKEDNTIASYEEPGNEHMKGSSNYEGAFYEYKFDQVETRDQLYCYELLYTNFDNNLIALDTVCIAAPNSVITYAQANPNPFERTTTIEYTVDDDVYLTMSIYDLTGREALRLMDHVLVEKGTYTLDVSMPEFASQGLYDLVLIADPIDDESVELSQAIVKLQVIR